jgi:hypothetical protein
MPSKPEVRRRLRAERARVEALHQARAAADGLGPIEPDPNAPKVRCPDCGEEFSQTIPGSPLERCGRSA